MKNKKILVYDVAAENGGGLFVLKDFYQSACKYYEKNKDITFIFITSFPLLEPVDGIEVLSFPWIKKSWLHRLYFEKIYIKKVLKNIVPNCIVSLQNTTVSHYKGKQYVYMHQSLQYCVKKFSFLKKNERALAVRQRIICKGYKKGLKKAEKIYVQTEWIREATQNWVQTDDEKFEIVPVRVTDIPTQIPIYEGLNKRCFFYPARAEVYKNHQVILDACQILKTWGITDYKVVFTVDENEGPYAKTLAENTHGLPIELIGAIPLEKVFSYYSSSILLFPSYLETCGLPLLEASAMGAVIIASDMSFCREGLKDYENVYYFDYFDATALATYMKKIIIGEIIYKEIPNKIVEREEKNLLNVVMRDILKEINGK